MQTAMGLIKTVMIVLTKATYRKSIHAAQASVQIPLIHLVKMAWCKITVNHSLNKGMTVAATASTKTATDESMKPMFPSPQPALLERYVSKTE